MTRSHDASEYEPEDPPMWFSAIVLGIVGTIAIVIIFGFVSSFVPPAATVTTADSDGAITGVSNVKGTLEVGSPVFGEGGASFLVQLDEPFVGDYGEGRVSAVNPQGEVVASTRLQTSESAGELALAEGTYTVYYTADGEIRGQVQVTVETEPQTILDLFGGV